MKDWIFRILMTLMAANLCLIIWIMYTTPQPQCLNGIVMVPDKGGDMWVQKGLWATHCMPVDKD